MSQRSTDFGEIQLTIDERCDYITIIRVKGDPLRAQQGVITAICPVV